MMVSGVYKTDSQSSKWTPLHIAARWDRKEVVEVLLAHKADVNACTSEGMSPLHMAALARSPEIVNLLLAAGAKADVKGRWGQTPLHLAIGDFNWLYRLKPDAFITVQNSKRPNPKWYIVGTVFSCTDGPNHDSLAPKAIGIACYTNYADDEKIVSSLLDAKANPNSTDSGGSTPLHKAVWLDAVGIAKLLLDHKAAPGIKDAKGKTPLDCATEQKKLKTAKLLRGISRDQVRP